MQVFAQSDPGRLIQGKIYEVVIDGCMFGIGMIQQSGNVRELAFFFAEFEQGIVNMGALKSVLKAPDAQEFPFFDSKHVSRIHDAAKEFRGPARFE